MILARLPRSARHALSSRPARSARSARSARPAHSTRAGVSARTLAAASSDRSREFSPLGPAMVVALGGVVFSALRRMKARSARRDAGLLDRD